MSFRNYICVFRWIFIVVCVEEESILVEEKSYDLLSFLIVYSQIKF